MEYELKATKEEIEALRVMLHRACQHSGIEVAEAAAHWNRKLVRVMQTELPPEKANGKMQERDARVAGGPR